MPDRVRGNERQAAHQPGSELRYGLGKCVAAARFNQKRLTETGRFANLPVVGQPACHDRIALVSSVHEIGLPGTHANLAVKLMRIGIYQAAAVAERLRELGVEAAEPVLSPVQPAEKEILLGDVARADPAEIVSFSRRGIAFAGVNRSGSCLVLPQIKFVGDPESGIEARALGITRCGQIAELDVAGPGAFFFFRFLIGS